MNFFMPNHAGDDRTRAYADVDLQPRRLKPERVSM
jgi:hypothetical protein